MTGSGSSLGTCSVFGAGVDGGCSPESPNIRSMGSVLGLRPRNRSNTSLGLQLPPKDRNVERNLKQKDQVRIDRRFGQLPGRDFQGRLVSCIESTVANHVRL